MSQVTILSPTGEPETLELRDRSLAALLAWLVPGAGHFYQGRSAKGLLFSTCILGTFFYGMVLEAGRVVYASWGGDETRLPYLCQVFTGLPALPALVQTYRVKHDKAPLLGGFMAPPQGNALSEWHRQYNRSFEYGTVYTMIAGLLNILAIFDAWLGPVQFDHEKEARQRKKKTAPADAEPQPS